MKLTPEQIEIIHSTGNIMINAVAGSGKTTTLIEYARARQDKGTILYIAFNKSVKIEAAKKFAEKDIKNVRIETAHSLAFDHVVRNTKYKLKENGYKTAEIAELLGLNGYDQKHAEYILANHINKYITYFCNSNKQKVQELDYLTVVFDKEARQFVTNYKPKIEQYTREFLAKMDRGEIDITHDFYLKKFQLQKPILPYDFILFDEGQDASEAMLDVFAAQPATKVIVGDKHQQIYSWRYAVNSLEKMDYPTYYLSSSFRFTNEIASLATRILLWKAHLGKAGKTVINGYGDSEAVTTKAVIARTNTSLLIKAIELLIEKKEIKNLYFEGRFETYTYADEGASIYDVLNLYLDNRKLIKDKLIASMTSIGELEEYIEKTEDAQLGLILEVVKKYSDKLPLYIKKIKEFHLASDDKQKADMIFSTVHKCKGMEYDEVTLANDFITETKLKKYIDESGLEALNINKLIEEINILYVAVTRTRNKLNIPVDLLPISRINVLKLPPEQPIEAEEPTKGKAYSFDGARKKNKAAFTPWTSSEEDKLTAMVNEGLPIKDIAQKLNRSIGAIDARISKLELDVI